MGLMTVSYSTTGNAKVVSISIIIESPEYFDQLYSWLQNVGYTHFTFVIDCYYAYDYILHNATRVNILKSYGELIPRLPYMQQNTTAQREAWINSVTSDWKTYVGYVPKGIMDFVPDTFSANYAASLGYTYIQGYCQDQWAVDAISEIGGWQEPYYASSSNILVPDNSSQSTGLVVLPHATADWIDSYTVWQGLQLHPMNVMQQYDNNTAKAEAYFYALTNDTLLDCAPVSLANIQFEWNYCVNYNDTTIVANWLTGLIDHTAISAQYQLMDYTDFVTWFRSAYPANPTYRVDFTSPYNSSDSIEWYWSTQYRVARVNGNVVSFVDYTIQAPDKYLTQVGYVNWAGPMQSDPDNCIDDSLFVTIAALGGGVMRYPAIKSQEFAYSGDLADFASTYYSARTNAQTTNSINIPAIAALTITAVAIASLVVGLARGRRRIKKREKRNSTL